jgi:hypothetical protein
MLWMRGENMLATLAASSILIFAQAGSEVLPAGADISFKAHTLNGTEISTATLRGKPTLIVLWGPWSQKSFRAVEAADRMRDKYGAKLRVVRLRAGTRPATPSLFRKPIPSFTSSTGSTPPSAIRTTRSPRKCSRRSVSLRFMSWTQPARSWVATSD